MNGYRLKSNNFATTTMSLRIIICVAVALTLVNLHSVHSLVGLEYILGESKCRVENRGGPGKQMKILKISHFQDVVYQWNFYIREAFRYASFAEI